MVRVTANAAGIIRACEPTNQSTAVDYLTAPGNPGLTLFVAFRLQIARSQL